MVLLNCCALRRRSSGRWSPAAGSSDALLVGAVGPEGDRQLVEALVDLVELQRGGGAAGWSSTALSRIGRSPGLYAGVSCTNRSPTIAGETITALASAGTLYFASYHILT